MTLKDVESRLWEIASLSIREGALETTRELQRLITDVGTRTSKYHSAKALIRKSLKRQLKLLGKHRRERKRPGRFS